MTNAADSPAPDLAPGAACIVMLRAGGLQIQRPIHQPAEPIGLPGLMVLSRLDLRPRPYVFPIIREVVAETGVDEEELTATVHRWHQISVITQGDRVVHRPAPDAVAEQGQAELQISDRSLICVRLPLAFRLCEGRFELIDHQGRRVVALTPAELNVISMFAVPRTPRAVVDALSGGPAADFGGVEGLCGLLARLGCANLLGRDADARTAGREVSPDEDAEAALHVVFDRHAAAQDVAERDREAKSGPRTKVIPVASDVSIPAGLGMVVAYSRSYDDGRLQDVYDFRTDWIWSDERLEQFTAKPAVYLFSNYLWSHAQNVERSARIKELSPASVTIHGGPDVPKYEADGSHHLEALPHIDVLVRGEGEVTTAAVLAALSQVMGSTSIDLSVLEDVAGITYRDGDRIVRNADRDRVSDLDTLPSPYLTGLFDMFRGAPGLSATLETNRGCPYGCTFCDWGSATNTRVRRFDIERVAAEIHWCGDVGVAVISLADANFGMLKRDIDIARMIADTRVATGFPKVLGVAYAKNTVRNLIEIVQILAEADVMAQGVLALQSMHEPTLEAINRSNIKTERYDELADEMRRAGLPMMVELMLGLPGQTVESFADDLQRCIDAELPARINNTVLLINSPMNAPDYRAEHRIEVSAPPGPGVETRITATSTFSGSDLVEMEHLRIMMVFHENFGVLRLVARFVRQEVGMRDIDFYRWLRDQVLSDGGKHPTLHTLMVLGSAMMTAPISWSLVVDELRGLLVSELGLGDDSAFDAVLQAQLAILPVLGRSFPHSVELAHDVVAWHSALIEEKNGGNRLEWTDRVPRLKKFGPRRLDVDDPDAIVDLAIGSSVELTTFGMNWELDSGLSRARISAAQFADFLPGDDGTESRTGDAPDQPWEPSVSAVSLGRSPGISVGD